MAGRDVVYGILVKAKDAVSSTLKKVGTTGKKALQKDLGGAAEKAKKNLEFLSHAVTGLNQGMELLKKGFEMAKVVFEQTITRALEQRAAFDKQRQDWVKMTDQLQRLAALVGDLLIPIILGLADAFAEDADAAEEFLSKNRAIIGSGLVEWLQEAASVLTSGVAAALDLGAKAWFGWLQLIELVKLAVDRMFEVYFAGWKAAFGVMAQVLDALGADGVAGKLREAEKAASSLGSEFELSGDNALKALHALVKEQDEVEDGIADIESAVQKGIGAVAVAITKRFGEELDKIPPRWREIRDAALAASTAQLKAQEEAIRAEMQLHALRDQLALDADMKRTERMQKDLDAYEALITLQEEQAQQTADTITNFMQVASEDLIAALDIVKDESLTTGQKVGQVFTKLWNSMSQQMTQWLMQYLQQQAQQQAASRQTAITDATNQIAPAQAKAVNAHAGIPYVGIALGVAAAAQAIGLILGYVASLDTGGMVPHDGLAMLHKDELVVPQKSVKPFNRAMSELGLGGLVSGGSPDMVRKVQEDRVLNLNVQYHSMASPTSKTEARHSFVNYVIPTVRDASRLDVVDPLSVGL